MKRILLFMSSLVAILCVKKIARVYALAIFI